LKVPPGHRQRTGSDVYDSVITKKLALKGAMVIIGHSDTNISTVGGVAIKFDRDIVNATFIDSYITSTGNYDIETSSDVDAGSYLKLVNVTFNKSDVSINDEDFELVNNYYIDVNVSDSSSLGVADANVSAYYVNGSMAFSEMSRGEVDLSDSDWTNGLVGYWRMNNDSSVGENASYVYDFSGNGNNGTVYGDISDSDSGATSEGRINGGYMFDGDGDYVDVGDDESLNITNAITVSAWIKTNMPLT